MGNMNKTIPEYLYHYTDVDTLALILSNKTIRFNSLVNMDDKQEQMSRDKQNFGRFVFVSCWTDDEKESIPMWRMYTTKGRGVRIKLPVNPFKIYEYTGKELRDKHSLSSLLSLGDESIPHRFIIPDTELFGKDYHLFNMNENNQLYRIKYVDDIDILKPNYLNRTNTGIDIDINKVGCYKNTYWEFQKEWRYILRIFPFNMKELTSLSVEEVQKRNIPLIKGFLNGNISLPFDYYDLHLADSNYEKMGITLSPDISQSAKLFTQLLVDRYNPKCKIKESVLTNLIQ